MLKQILRELYVEPELLAELDEEQKQILFYKMREEQVRRWKLREENLPPRTKHKSVRQTKSGGSKRKVAFMQGKDGEQWVWVMGEHKDDKTIEQILEAEEQQKARELAEREAEQLRKQEEAELLEKIKEEEAALERERLEKEAELKRKEQEEAELHRSKKEAKAAAEKLKEERRHEDEAKEHKLQAIKLRHDRWRRRSEAEQAERAEKRSSQLFLSFRDARRRFEKAAEAGSIRLEADWKEQESRSRQAQAERQMIARRARKEVNLTQRLVKTESQMINDLDLPAVTSEKTQAAAMLGKKAVIRRQMSLTLEKKEILSWFKKEEIPRGSGRDPDTKQIQPWFHGIITRQQAEQLLSDKPTGSFLVRVSERVCGYAVSYRDEHRCKHYLIDTSAGSYQFFGSHQVAHAGLNQLVDYHKTYPISFVGQELLLHACGQQQQAPPDFAELFDDT